MIGLHADRRSVAQLETSIGYVFRPVDDLRKSFRAAQPSDGIVMNKVFHLEWFGGGNNPLEIFENPTPADLKQLCQKIKNTDLYLVGYLGYEWGAALEGIGPSCANDALKVPSSWFGLYEGTMDHGLWTMDYGQRTEDNGQRTTDQKQKGVGPLSVVRCCALSLSKGPLSVVPPLSSFSKENYLQSILKIKDYLRAGDCYQVNLSQRFETKVNEDPWTIYQRLREISPAPYSAFIDTGGFQILSSSPELFLEARADGTLITKPIKGTRKRGATPQEDEALMKDLQNNPKDKAELLMITDLERNDLGKVSVPSSVHVPQLQKIETYAQVHHLVSTVTGKRKENCDIIDVLAAMMPGGSITGAPKIRAMEIIRELEPVNRGVYTGAIGWIGPNNTAHFNIAIRTILLQNNTAYFSAGGGIVIDSDPEMEYEESLIKASGMMKALQP